MQVPFQVKSLFPYESTYEDDLNFGSGVVITVTSIENDEWFSGEYNGKSGMFPKNFVEVIQAPAVPTLNRPVRQAPKEEAEPPKEKETEPEPPTAAAESHSPAKPAAATHSIPKPAQTSHSVPMPKGPGSKPVDPYSIKKQFVAASTSSYVPKVKPRDDSNLVAHPVHEAKHADVKSNMDEPEREHKEDIDEAAPKMTLKERIAMIQKQQQEEAEREAAALKKKEERKKRQAAEKEKLQQLRQAQPPQAGGDTASIATHGTGGSVGSEAPISPIEARRPASIISAEVGHGEDDEVDTGEQAEVEDEQDEEQEEEEEEEEEDEDEKRRRLVERMAKIAGGRNMFGLPFGAPAAPPAAPAPAPAPTKKEAAPAAHHDDYDEEEEEEEEADAREVEKDEETVVQKPIRLEKHNTTEIETTGYDADLSEASKPEERKEDDDEEEIEEHHPPHPHHHPSHAPPPPPPTTREEEDEEIAPHHRHHHHHTKEAPPPPPPVADHPPPIPGTLPQSTPPIPSSGPTFGPLTTPPIPGAAPPIPGSVPPNIPTSVPPTIPTSAPPPPIPGTVPPPLQTRHTADLNHNDDDDADFEFVDRAPPVPGVPRAQTLGSFDDEQAPSLPKRSATMVSRHHTHSPRSSLDSTHKRKSLDLSISRSRSLKDTSSVKSHAEISSEIDRIVPDLVYKLENQKISSKGNKKVQLVLELDYQNGTLVNHDVRVKSHH
ncbi:Myosin tail region-interacting protein MTI1 [Candida viswanathii]|uniref:Myosin tail region-interacting protein MTI1 n=1 Tax=Candida viswanathii TaxID=5486 RepID=A0A367YDJ3_9ASCO|nr:Myosin tail region-interacting protein MTI1 [Candida viswanathii]